MIILFKFLLEIKWPWITWKTTNQTKSLDLGVIVGWPILINLLLNQARNHGNLICILSRPCSLDTKREASQRRRRPIQVIKRDLHVLGIVNTDLMLAPSLLKLIIDPGILDLHPARALDLPLQNEQLEHALISTENALEGIASQGRRKGRLRGRVLYFQEFVLNVWDRHLETVLTGYELAFKLGDPLELSLPHLLEFHYHLGLKRIFLIQTHGLSLFSSFHFGIHEYSPLHALHFQ